MRTTYPAGHHAKAACYVCQRARVGIDTEVPIVGEGSLFICEGCVRDMAQLTGWLTPEQRITLDTELAQARERIARLEASRRTDRELILTMADRLGERLAVSAALEDA